MVVHLQARGCMDQPADAFTNFSAPGTDHIYLLTTSLILIELIYKTKVIYIFVVR